MKNYLSNLDRRLACLLRKIGKEADEKQLPAYIVGGVVRDIILKKKNLDLDIVVEGDAIVLAKVLSGKWKKKLTVHKQFGTASSEDPGGLNIDFATARRERYTRSGALPMVQPGNLKEDLFRRDFTVNAMAVTINPGCFGQLIDQFGGLKDLSEKKIRVLHNQSFIDDPTRILRAVRFEQRFNFKMERQTLLLMKAALGKNILKNITPARYFTELKKILSETDPIRCLKRLHQLGGLHFIDLKLSFNAQDMGRIHQRIQEIKQMQLISKNSYWLIYFMALMARSDNRVIERVLKRFPLTREGQAGVRQSRNAKDLIRKLSDQGLLPSQVYQILKPLTLEAVLYLRIRAPQPAVCRRIDRFLAEDVHAELCINGKDLNRIGIVSGRKMGKILEDVLYLKINKVIRTKKEELNAALLSSRQD